MVRTIINWKSWSNENAAEKATTQICKDCKKEFLIDKKDKEFFAQRGWALPVRCPACRERKKLKNQKK